MKKLIFSLICLLMVCSFVISCEEEKGSDKEITLPNEQTTKPPKAQNDDPNNGYGDIIIPKDEYLKEMLRQDKLAGAFLLLLFGTALHILRCFPVRFQVFFRTYQMSMRQAVSKDQAEAPS